MKNQFSDLEHDLRVLTTHVDQPVTLILADYGLAQLGPLLTHRSQAALPFAGEYRLIDFALSNCAHSGIEIVGVITQYQSRSLQNHIAYGRPWDLDRRHGGLTLLHPYQGRGGMRWYSGSADAVYQNQDFILHYGTDETLILAGDQVYKQDLNVLITQHRQTGADLTIATVPVEATQARQYDTLCVNEFGRVETLFPAGSAQAGPLAVIGIMMFNTEVLNWRLNQDAQDADSTHQLVRDVVRRMIEEGDRVLAFPYTGYWNCLHTIEDYWQANLDLLGDPPPLNLHDNGWPIRTHVIPRPPTRIQVSGRVLHSLISGGCIIEGTVEYAILSPGVYVGPGAVVRNAVVMENVVIEECALVQNAILDVEVTVGQQAQVGIAARYAPTAMASEPTPITVVEKETHIRTGAIVQPDQNITFARRRARVDAV